ncbi:hypothetical protein GP486_002892 [Trichoglossum hirsutum]|uniref:Uncharacterized protein n=1 Tax=Trichoglossum hirsutum TaxID=265104 RepID=A0A9P8LE38_9PEZI|nr:hypothetical protein GP486_002892 [Trichoglossum hirsutum]
MEGMNEIYPVDDSNAKAASLAPLPKENTVFLSERSNRSSPRLSSSSDRATSPISRLKRSGNNLSTTSVNSTPSRQQSPSRKRRGAPSPPAELDIQAARMLCSTTDAALVNLTDDELMGHVKCLTALTESAGEVLEYWLKRKDAALGDKEAFEGVIENLVKHARKVRK